MLKVSLNHLCRADMRISARLVVLIVCRRCNLLNIQGPVDQIERQMKAVVRNRGAFVTEPPLSKTSCRQDSYRPFQKLGPSCRRSAVRYQRTAAVAVRADASVLVPEI